MDEAQQAELERLRARVANLERFASRLAHELSTPLVTARGFASLLLDTGAWDDATRDALERIERAAARAEAIVRERLDSATAAVPAKVDVRSALRDAARNARSEGTEVDLQLDAPAVESYAFAVPAVAIEVLTLVIEGVQRRAGGARPVTAAIVPGATDAVTVVVSAEGPPFTEADERDVLDGGTTDPALVPLAVASRALAGQAGRMWCVADGHDVTAATVTLPRHIAGAG